MIAIQRELYFEGPHEEDEGARVERLKGQMKRVYNALARESGRRFTPEQLVRETGDNWASISAQIRHLRKDRFGAHDIRKNHRGGGLYEYWLEGAGP